MSVPELLFSNDISVLAARLEAYASVFVVADRRVRRFIAEPLVEQCIEKGVAIRGVFYIRASERHKTYGTVERIQRWLIGVGADRDALVLAVGGGIVTDLAGFAASTYKRGVRYANVPTTLLAMCDASVGGKTACNIGGYKNMAGVVHQPEFTFVNVDFARSLEWEQLRDGYAELLKTFIIADAASYAGAVDDADFSRLPEFVERAARIKADIVSRDPFDNDVRRVLNLGHTFAHAIECKSAKSLLRRTIAGERGLFGFTCGRISHGSAVAVGIIMAARKSERDGVALQPGLTERLESDFETVGLPVSCPWSEKELGEIARTDKKVLDGVLHYVLIEKIGKVVVI